MTPVFLLPESVLREDGQSEELALDFTQGRLLMLTLRITRILERSRDRQAWQSLAAFPKKSYCGTYSLLMDLSGRPEVRHLRVQWKMSRWNHRESKPVFTFGVSMEELRARVAGAA